MKRSKKVVYASMRKSWVPHSITTITLASFALTGCGDSKQDASLYRSLDECETDNPQIAEECKAAYQYALDDAEKTAPKYRSVSDCEDEFGTNGCVQSRSNSSWFMPAMAGFMFARALNNNSYSSFYSQPLYTSYNPRSSYYRNWLSSDGYQYGSYRSSGKNHSIKVSKDQMKPKAATTRTISRGGFGSSVKAKSSWGSSRSSHSKSKGWGG